VAPTAHQIVDPATLGRNSASLEGHGTALANLCLARGLVAPSGEVSPRSRDGRPPRARFRLARGLDAPSSEVPPRSGAGRPLGRGSARSRTSWAHRLHTFSPDRGISCTDICRCPGQRRIHATTRLGITPRRCSANSPGEAIPITVRRCAAWPVSVP
jgi:hypothetical protein